MSSAGIVAAVLGLVFQSPIKGSPFIFFGGGKLQFKFSVSVARPADVLLLRQVEAYHPILEEEDLSSAMIFLWDDILLKFWFSHYEITVTRIFRVHFS